jgi:hypothetical protein
MVHIVRCASGGHVGCCIVYPDGMISSFISDTMEMFRPFTNHDRMLTLRSVADHPFGDCYIQKSYVSSRLSVLTDAL